jgi:hypothetical protein
MARRNLVVVRAGDESLHPRWLEGNGERNWDCIVSYFGDDPNLFRVDDVIRIDGGGPKWQGLHDVFVKSPELLQNYEYVLLPDDDLLMCKDDINRLFEICETHKFEVCHPTLTWDSYYSHFITLHNTGTRIRYTNFIELMAPCLSRRLLIETLSLFANTVSGWGLEGVWAKLAGPTRTALIDEVAICHTRPMGGPNYRFLAAKNVSAWEERRSFCHTIGLEDERPIETYSAVLSDGRWLHRGRNDRAFDFRLLRGWLPALKNPKMPRGYMVKRMLGYSYKALTQTPYRVIQNS